MEEKMKKALLAAALVVLSAAARDRQRVHIVSDVE